MLNRTLALFCWLASSWLYAQSSEIYVDYELGPSARPSNFEAMNRLVQNRALASSLASGVSSLNRSIDSLMEALFYSIMDQKFRVEASDTLALSTGFERDVHNTALGSYVVVDKFRVGPGFLKDLGKIRGLPLTFSNQTDLFITNASHRSDALRKAESNKNPYWRELFNNWFGVLPLLSRILPPSFNPEELYDPVTYLSTPFLFPRDVQEALEMPLGTVRSYGLAGTTQLGIDLKGRSLNNLQEALSLGDLNLTVPFAFFREGEHRISILRRNENVVWLALSELRRIGSSLNFSLQKRYAAFQQLVTWWTGLPIAIAPIDFGILKAKNIQMDELYGFDLRQRAAQDAFTKALHGDFSLARSLGEGQPKALEQHGVTFHFRRLSNKDENGLRQGRSFYVAQNQRQSQMSDGESRTFDLQGEFLTLDADFFLEDRDWNVLVGPETSEYKNRLSIPVLKEKDPVQGDRYKLANNSEHPLYMTAALRFTDDFVDTREYQNIISLFREYTGLKFEDVPTIPILAKDLQSSLLKRQALANPMDEVTRRELTPTHLGRLSAYAHLYFSHEVMLKLASKSNADFWSAFAQGFGVEAVYWGKEGEAKGVPYYANWLGSYILSPLRLMNIDSSYPDLVREGRRVSQAFDRLLKAQEPLAILDAYREILETTHPVELMHSLVLLAKGLPLPILAGFNTTVKNRGEDTPDIKLAKDEFAKLNNRVYGSPWPIPPLKRDQSVEEKLATFEPGPYQAQHTPPSAKRLTLHLDRYITGLQINHLSRLLAELQVQNPPSRRSLLYAYVRIEQHSPINIGRFVLGEELLELRPLDFELTDEIAPDTGSSGIYRVPLNGPEGLKAGEYFDRAILEGEALDFIVSLSENAEQWGVEQKISFRVENGMLQKL